MQTEIDRLNEFLGYVKGLELIEKQKPKEPAKINIIKIGETIIDLQQVATEGEPNMPPKYADGGFRQKKYILEYRFVHEGKRYSVYGKTKQECWNKRTDFISGKKISKPNKSRETVKEWLLLWAETFKKPKVTQAYYDTIVRYINNNLLKIGDIELKKLTTIDIQQLLIKETRNNTRIKVASLLSDSLYKAFALQKIKHNPFLAVEIKKEKSKNFPALPPELQDKLLSEIKEPYLSLYKFSCCTGLRISEALGLAVKDIDFKNCVLHVKQQRPRDNKVTTLLKTNAAYRMVKFLPELFTGCDLSGELLFGHIVHVAAVSYFKRLFKRLEIDEYVIHSFRHTFISNCYYVGIRDKQIQAWAGHSKVETTINTYTHLLSGTSAFVKYAENLKKTLNSTPQ